MASQKVYNLFNNSPLSRFFHQNATTLHYHVVGMFKREEVVDGDQGKRFQFYFGYTMLFIGICVVVGVICYLFTNIAKNVSKSIKDSCIKRNEARLTGRPNSAERKLSWIQRVSSMDARIFTILSMVPSTILLEEIMSWLPCHLLRIVGRLEHGL